jgi:hypothetical protein
MDEVGVRPGKVGLEERRTDGDSGWVVRRLGRIDDSYNCLVERLVEDGKVCGVATNTDQRSIYRVRVGVSASNKTTPYFPTFPEYIVLSTFYRDQKLKE